MFYDRFCELSKRKGKTPNMAVAEIGLSNSIATTWKKRGSTPHGDTLLKIADYFGVSVDELIDENKKTDQPEGQPVNEYDKFWSNLTEDEKKAVYDFAKLHWHKPE